MTHLPPQSGLAICALGPLNVAKDGEPVGKLGTRKAEALLVYLAAQGQPQPREHVATLLWESSSQERASNNLSIALSGLRKQVGDWLDTTWQDVALKPDNMWLDADAFATGIEASRALPAASVRVPQLERMLALYRGSLLDGFRLRSASGFMTWLDETRRHMRTLAVEALESVAEFYSAQTAFDRVVEHAERLVAIEPAHEVGYRYLMQAHATLGNADAAEAHYRALQSALKRELGVAPSAETNALLHRIRTKTFAISAPQSSAAATHNIPVALTPFFGRTRELSYIAERLADPACRLLTLAGTGGAGKSRLAQEAARAVAERYANGVWFVAAPTVDGDGDEHSTRLVQAIGDAVGFTFSGPRTPKRQLLDYLRNKQMLLVLDSFEQLMDAVDAVLDLLEIAPGVTLLVTSRERLNVRVEWLLHVDGLPYPTDAASGDDASFPALDLFETHARRVDDGFVISAETRPAIVRICQLVDGLPLGLELAAAGIRHSDCAAVADALAHNIDFLSSTLRDVPPRHRSLRAVFTYSWDRLSPLEQRLFSRLSVFRGTFDRQAARAVADAALPALIALIDKSLLQTAAGGRYQMHAVLRQFGAEKLDAGASMATETRERHSHFYLDLIRSQRGRLNGAEQADALAVIGLDLDNVRAAWRNAITAERMDLVASATVGLGRFFEVRGQFSDGDGLLGLVVDATRGDASAENAHAIALLEQGKFKHYLTQYDSAEALLQDAAQRLDALGLSAEYAYALNWLGIVAFTRSNYEEAERLHTASLALCEQIGDRQGIARAYNYLANVASITGRPDEARRLYQQSLTIYRRLGSVWGMARALNNLGNLAYYAGDARAAKAYYEEGRELADSLDNLWVRARSRKNLGNVAYSLGEYDAARTLYEEALALSREIGDGWGESSTLKNLGNVLFGMGELQKAESYLTASEQLCRVIGNKRGVALALAHLARVAVAQGRGAQAETWARDSLARNEAIGFQRGQALAWIALGEMMLLSADSDTARSHFARAIEAARSVGARPELCMAALGLACCIGDSATRDGLLAAILAEEAAPAETRRDALAMLGSQPEHAASLDDLLAVISAAGDSS